MTNNDILRSIRYTLDLADHKIVELVKLGGETVDKADVARWLLAEDERDYLDCGHLPMNAFLDGLITQRRGAREPQPGQQAPAVKVVARITNNLALKKLRIAFELQEDDLVDIFNRAQFRISRPEISALFRAPGHKNYRVCGDQELRNFLKGLTLRLRA